MASTSRGACILRTARLWDADMACNHLDESGIAYYRRQETSSGLEFAMPVAAVSAPGVWFTVWVPNEEAEAAREALGELRIELDREPEVVDRATAPANRRLIFAAATIMLAFLVLGFIQQCAGAIRQLARP